MSDKPLVEGGLDTSILKVEKFQETVGGEVCDTEQFSFQVPSHLGSNIFGAGETSEGQVAPVPGVVDHEKLVDGLTRELGSRGVRTTAPELKNLHSGIQSSMRVVDSKAEGGLLIAAKTGKVLPKQSAPELIPAGMDLAEIPAEKRGAPMVHHLRKND
jgi:hypothetical protein